MTHRTDRVHLDHGVPRCAAVHGCNRRESCARYMAPIGKSPLADYSIPSPMFFGCQSFHPIRRPVKVEQPRRVHPPLGSFA